MDKSLIIKFNEMKNQIVSAVNEAYRNGVPYFIIESLVSDIYHQLQNGASSELTCALNDMAKTEAKTDESDKT